jgi:DNA mismatch endonuclease (patch repair protein)
MMAAIRGKDTRPEMTIRRGLHARGFRYRLHARNLPGKPDLVFPARRAALFVHGCFWHGHGCPMFRWPGSRVDFWRAKIEGNRARDRAAEEALEAAGWRVLTVWECALNGRGRLPPDRVLDLAAAWLATGEGRMAIQGDGPHGAD